MDKIKLVLRGRPSTNIELDFQGHEGVSEVFKLGFALGCVHPVTGSYVADGEGLAHMQDQLAGVVSAAFHGLAGIGALVRVADPSGLTAEDMENLGLVIDNLARLGLEAQSKADGIGLG